MHTKGPWTVDARYLSEVQTADDKTVASCWHEHADGQEITVRGVLCCSLEESAANARLISTAPDFADAAPNAADILDHYADFIRREVKANDLERHLYLPLIEQTAADLRAAIAKATGAGA